jgi:hypothetical protein
VSEGSGSTVNYVPVVHDGERHTTDVTVSGGRVELGRAGLFDRDELLLALAVTHEDVKRIRGET